MERPKAGIALLVLVAITTASGALLGLSMRPQAVSVDLQQPANERPVGAPGETRVPAETVIEKQPSSRQ
ncbi:MAG: hypothetical protein KA435_00570 [Azonexus sp.]|nr:hypothetical protein [Azonexus sp.]MBP6201524.1 hypothetical protein [Azonexus sp.]